jgi:hypothetical protein
MLQVAVMLPQSASIAAEYTDIIKILNFNTYVYYSYLRSIKFRILVQSVILSINLQLLRNMIFTMKATTSCIKQTVCLLVKYKYTTGNQSLSISHSRPHQTQHNLSHQFYQFI